MADVLKAEYLNTGGNCYVLFGTLHGSFADMPDIVYFAGSVDCEETPRIDFYRTEESAYNCDFGGDDYIQTAYLEDADWVGEIWRKAFCRAIAFGKSWDSYVACIDYEKLCRNYRLW